jgi:hypothetical protein
VRFGQRSTQGGVQRFLEGAVELGGSRSVAALNSQKTQPEIVAPVAPPYREISGASSL